VGVTGRRILLPALALLVVSLAGELVHASNVLRASRIVRAVALTTGALPRDASAQPALRHNLALAIEAVRLDPDSLAAAQALGSIYLLLNRPADATDAYRRALALQPAAEIYMDLGHAALAAGDTAQARQRYARALELDTRLAVQIPVAAR